MASLSADSTVAVLQESTKPISQDELKAIKIKRKEWRSNQLGFWGENNANGTACILVIHYGFKDIENFDRDFDDQIDVHYLKETFSSIKYYETSEAKDEVLDLLANKDKIKEKFGLKGNESPDLFIVCVMTHGLIDGLLFTHHENAQGHFETFNVTDIFQGLKSEYLENTLKLVIISACRGNIVDQIFHGGEPRRLEEEGLIQSSDVPKNDDRLNLNAVRVTTEPNSQNFVIMFSCVERTASLRIAEHGTFLIQSLCESLNLLEKDSPLEEFLTMVQHYVHKEYNVKIGCGTTPEVKLFKHKKFTFFKSNCQTLNNTDTTDTLYYDWTSIKGKPLLSRKAHFFTTERKPASTSGAVNLESAISRLAVAFKSNFEFEDYFHQNIEDLELAVTSGQADGCILVCVVAEITRRKNSDGIEELCIVTENRGTKFIKDILYKMIGPSTGIWIGKPKICILLNTSHTAQALSSDLPLPYESTEFSRIGTIHAGILTLILPHKDSVDQFLAKLEYFTSSGQTNTAAMQEFFVALLQEATSHNNISPMILSTLNTRLNMDFPRQIVIDNFTIEAEGETTQASLSQLMEKMGCTSSALDENQPPERYMAWLVSSAARYGKSHLMNYLVHCTQKSRSFLQIDLSSCYSLLRNFDWTTRTYNNFFEDYCIEMQKPQPTLEANDVVILDAFDAVENELQPNLIDMIMEMVSAKINLWITTRSECKLKFIDIHPLSVVEIENMSREDQVKFLIFKLEAEIDQDVIGQILDKVCDAYAEDLTTNVGMLEKLADFLKKNDHRPIVNNHAPLNIYKLSEHIFEETVESIITNSGITKNSMAYLRAHQNVVTDFGKCADAYFRNIAVDRFKSVITDLNGYGIMVVDEEQNKVDSVISETLTCYLFVKQNRVQPEVLNNLNLDQDQQERFHRMKQDHDLMNPNQ